MALAGVLAFTVISVFIKGIGFAYAFWIGSALCDSHRFITDPSPTKFLKEPSLTSVPDSYPIISMLSVLWAKTSFNITYSKLQTGRYFAKFNIGPASLFMSTITYLFGVTRLSLMLIPAVFKMFRYKSVEAYLFSIVTPATSPRQIFYMKGKWTLNPDYDRRLAALVVKWLRNDTPALKHERVTELGKFLHDMQEVGGAYKAYKANFEIRTVDNKSLTFSHKYIPELSAQENCGGYATCFKKAQERDNYGLQTLITRVDTFKKPTTFLEIEQNSVKVNISKVTYIQKKELAVSAALNGWGHGLSPDLAAEAELIRVRVGSLRCHASFSSMPNEDFIRMIQESMELFSPEHTSLNYLLDATQNV